MKFRKFKVTLLVAIITGLFMSSSVLATDHCGTPYNEPQSAAVTCTPADNDVFEGSYGAWYSPNGNGYVVCPLDALYDPDGRSCRSTSDRHAGKAYVRGKVKAYVCGSSNTDSLGGCYYQDESTGYNYTDVLQMPSRFAPKAQGWTHRYVALFLENNGAKVISLH